MKTQNVNSKLKFDKNSLVELNDNQLQDVNGGSSPFCTGIIVSLLITRL